MLIATAHGVTLMDLLDNPSLDSILGGLQPVILSDQETRLRGLPQKTQRERKGPSAFAIAIELRARSRWVIHRDVEASVDNLLRGGKAPVVVRTLSPDGVVSTASAWLTDDP